MKKILFILFFLIINATAASISGNGCSSISDDNINFTVNVNDGTFDLDSVEVSWSGDPDELEDVKIDIDGCEDREDEDPNEYSSGETIEFYDCELSGNGIDVKLDYRWDEFEKDQEITFTFNGENGSTTSSVVIARSNNGNSQCEIINSSSGGSDGSEEEDATLPTCDRFDSDLEGWSGSNISHSGYYERMNVGSQGEASKIFDFGTENANKTIYISFDLDVRWSFDNSDDVIVSVNEEEIFNGSADTSEKIAIETDEEGQIAVSLYVDSDRSNEEARIDNICFDANPLPSEFSGTNFREFNEVYNINLRGDIKIFGNTILGQGYNNASCPDLDDGNGYSWASYWDVDSDDTTFNSSSSELTIPAGSTVKKAYLYWQGRAEEEDLTEVQTIKFKAPGGNYVELQADPSKLNWGEYGDDYPYQAMTEITEYMNESGTYTVADLWTTRPWDGLGAFGAWSIVVIYENDNEDLKNITVYDGYQEVYSDNTQQFNLSGFLTPTNGAVESNFLVFAGEGDVDIDGDYIKLDGTRLERNGENNNAFNSSITQNGELVTTKTPNCQNNMGIDIHSYDVGTSGQNIIGNEQTNVDIELGSEGDMYFPSVFAFSTELYVPDVCYEETYRKKDGNNSAPIYAGDTLEMEVYITNKNQEPAKGVSIKKVFSDRGEYERDTTAVFESGDFVSKTDSDGDDVVSYFDDNNSLIVNLGSGADEQGGGTIAKDQNETFKYEFTPATDGNITSEYFVKYIDESGGGAEAKVYNYVAIGQCSDRNKTSTTIPVDPSGKARIVEHDKTWNENNGALFTKVTGLQTTYDILFAIDESGSELVSGEINKVELIDMLSDNVVKTLSGIPTQIDQRESFTYTFDQAYKKVQFKITLDNGEEAFSNDFTVRPASYSGTISNLWAGQAKSIAAETLTADTYDGTGPATGYNTDLNKTHIAGISIDANKTCSSNTKAALIESFSATFEDGMNTDGSSIDVKDVGEFSFTLKDKDWTDGSNDQSEDHCIKNSAINTPDSDGKIGCDIQGDLAVEVAPYGLRIDNASFITANGNDWLYMSDQFFDQNVTVGATVTAYAEGGSDATNFDAACTSTNVTTLFDYSFDPYDNAAADVSINYSAVNGDMNTTDTDLAAIDTQVTAKADSFSAGSAPVSYVFKIDKNQDPLSPINVVLNDINITTSDIAFEESNTTLGANNQATFYYARVRPVDLTTSKQSDTTQAYIEVYDSSETLKLNMQQQSLNWYRFSRDSSNEILRVTGNAVVDHDVGFANGEAEIALNRSVIGTDSAILHLDIPPYLWYSKSGASYNYGDGKCSTNPCLFYRYVGSGQTSGVRSGDVNGSQLDRGSIDTKRPKGVKKFR